MSIYLITGATGGLGSSVVKQLSKTTDISDIAVLVRDTESDQAKEFKAKGHALRIADYENNEKLTEAFKYIEVLYFVSGSDIGSRLSQHKNVVEAAKAAGVEHVVYTSAGRKDESADSPVASVMDAHIKTENWLKESGMKYTFLQHNLYAEVIAMFIGDKETSLKSKQIFLPTGDGKTAFALRDDLAEAGAAVLKNANKHENKTYLLDGNKAITFNEIAQILSDVTNEEIRYTSPDVETFKTTMASYGVPEDIIGMMPVFSLGIAAGEFNSDSKDLEKLLGRTTTPIATFLKQVYA